MSEINLILSNNSLRNTTAACDSLGIHYDISKPSDAVQIKRWDSKTNDYVLVGEFKLPFFSRDVIRFSPDEEWMPLNNFLVRYGSILTTARSFEGNNGEKYWWKTIWPPQLTLRKYDEKDGGPLVIYHRNRINEPSYLEIRDSSVMDSLDKVIVTFLIMERWRRDRQKRRRAARVYGGGP